MRLTSCLLLLALAAPAVAQEQEIRSANLPPELEWELIRMYEGDAERVDGGATIEGTRGSIAATGGPLRLLGRIEGDLAMVGGDVILAGGSEVTGRITVVGGEVRMEEGVRVGGTITAYALSERRWRVVDRDRDEDEGEEDRWRSPRYEYGDGYARLTLSVGSGYNRVEGLPIQFGPVVRTASTNPLRLQALAIWRSEAGGLDTDRMGYRIEAEQRIDPARLGFGASAYSVIEPLDRWQISDLEAGLAAALFHDDYRDYYDRTGWSAFVRVEPAPGAEARIEYRNEEYGAVAAGDPWSLFDGDDVWRHQPLVGEGDLETVTGSLELDFRDDEERPEHGWFARLALERPVGGELSRPGLLPDGPSTASSYVVAPTEFDTDFTTGYLDVRQYSPVGYNSQLSVRLAAGGSLTGDALPPQFQHALGGIGTLPGFATFHADCGARSLAGVRGESNYYPAYGCDRFALAQVEYRGNLSLYFGLGDPDPEDDDWWDDVTIDIEPTWVVFFDAGQGWSYQDALGPDRDTGTLFDAGVGFLLDELGLYVALPLNGDVEQEPRFFVRLGQRF